jgi:hypothetical protein
MDFGKPLQINHANTSTNNKNALQQKLYLCQLEKFINLVNLECIL